MKKDPMKILDRVVWGLLGSGAAALGKLVLSVADASHAQAVELSKLTQQLEYHERELRILHERDSVIYRIESELGMHEKRLNKIEKGD